MPMLVLTLRRMLLGLRPSTSLSLRTRALYWAGSVGAQLVGWQPPGPRSRVGVRLSWLLTPLSELSLVLTGAWAKFSLLVLSLAHFTQAVVLAVFS